MNRLHSLGFPPKKKIHLRIPKRVFFYLHLLDRELGLVLEGVDGRLGEDLLQFEGHCPEVGLQKVEATFSVALQRTHYG